jgi:hypothetical protein
VQVGVDDAGVGHGILRNRSADHTGFVRFL